MELDVYISNLSVTADAADWRMPVGISAQLHHRGQTNSKYGHIKPSTVMSGNDKYKAWWCW